MRGMFDCSRLLRFPILPFFCGCALLGIAGLRAASVHPDDAAHALPDVTPDLPGPDTHTPLPHGGDTLHNDHHTSEYSHKASAPSPLMALLHHLPLLNDAGINPKARYVICLYSASWCGPCRRELPKVVATYLQKTENGRNKGNMELILFDFDHSESEARSWVARERVPFPATYHAPSTLPGARSVSSIPTMIVLDDKGRILLKGDPGDVLSHWDDISAGKVLPLAPSDNNRHH